MKNNKSVTRVNSIGRYKLTDTYKTSYKSGEIIF